ncbi:MAG: molecular chaperone DnaJ [Rhodospirillales bacterium]|nr:molecular chaperone DnaJ [Rhodospirillales bacterium]
MLPMLLAGIALLAGCLLLLNWIGTADLRTLTSVAKTAAVAVLVIIAIVLTMSGRIGWIIGLAPFAVPLFFRWRARGGSFGDLFGQTQGLPGGSTGGRTTRTRSRFLDMHLDHDSGAVDGSVLDGAYAGRMLNAMSLDEVLDLCRFLRQEDQPSSLLIEAYLDRRKPDWRTAGDGTAEAGGADGERTGAEANQGGRQESGAAKAMSREEAYRILGLAPGAADAEIRAAHRHLIASVHPDRGGSAFLAAQVNMARDLLLRKRASR